MVLMPAAGCLDGCTPTASLQQTLLLTPGREAVDHVFGSQLRRFEEHLHTHQRSVAASISELRRLREQRHALQLAKVLAAYQKLDIFERLLWSPALCEYLCAAVGPIVSQTTAPKHAAALHLRLCRKQLHLRGDSAGAAAIQTMLFWTRPERGTLASCLCRWFAQVQRRRAKRSLERLAESHHKETLSFRALTAWKWCLPDRQLAIAQGSSAETLRNSGQLAESRAPEGGSRILKHHYRGVSVASSRMRQQSGACRSPDRRMPAYPTSPPSLTQPPWRGTNRSPQRAARHMPNLELLRQRVADRRASTRTAAMQGTPCRAEHLSWISASSTFSSAKQTAA